MGSRAKVRNGGAGVDGGRPSPAIPGAAGAANFCFPCKRTDSCGSGHGRYGLPRAVIAAMAAPTTAAPRRGRSEPQVLDRLAVAADQAQGLDADLDVALDVLRAHLGVRGLGLEIGRAHV